MPTKHTLHVTGMHCGSCALLIDDTLDDLPGVLNTQTSRKHHRTTIELDTTANTLQDVIDTIASLGYHATSRD
ncbi:heavy metal transporter [Amycolatopsis antarctica]|uniref:Heavy metal transporter n=1 Tax=Amycolatopsis antarctica TaxID=1854586 RepID=A0A263CZF3_9PSEU|nr:heavy-metal-associated domain-containing protein [Amycolatopsis antarctica]OZM70686.1 heavy metal transporter [Amycolatopsis antarctica]